MLKSNFSTKKAQSALYVVLLVAVVALMMSVKRCSSKQTVTMQSGRITITAAAPAAN